MGVSIFLDFLLYSPQIRTRTIITRTRQGLSTTQNDENDDNNNNVEKDRMKNTTKTIATTKTVTTMTMIVHYTNKKK